jgi:hypothetical protein
MKKSYLKAVAVILCFGFLLMAVPNLNSAEKKAGNIGLSPIFSQSGLLMNSLFPWLNPIFSHGSKPADTKNQFGHGVVRPTDDMNTLKPGTGD